METAHQLDRLDRENLGGKLPQARRGGPGWRNSLGGHEEVRQAAPEAWRELLARDRGVNLDDAEDRLDVVLTEPCPS